MKASSKPSAPEIGPALDLSIALLQNGRIKEALLGLRLFAPQHEENPRLSNLVGLTYLSARDDGAALSWFDRAVQLDPAEARYWSNRGAALQQLGRADALSSYDEALRLGLKEPTLFYNRGNLLREAGRLDEAIASYDEALRLNPAYPEALRAGALVLRDLGQSEAALEFLDEATRLRPDFIEALLDRGEILQSLERLEDSLAAYDRILQCAPNNAAAWNNRAAALLALARYKEAAEALDAARKADPRSPQAWNNRGNLMLASLRPEAALSAFDQALELRPTYVEALFGRALANKQLGRFDETLAGLDAALAIEPQSDHVKNNKAVVLLQRGDFENGWDLYESRWIASRTPKHALRLPIPEWDGQALAGKNIVVFDEQGFGDAIQFVRFCLELEKLGANVTFFCRARLHRLLQSLPIRLVDRLEPGDLNPGERFDYQIALCSLPRALKTRVGSIPAPTSCLCAERSLVEKWAARLGSHGFKIGVCWRGSANPKADHGRAVPLAALAPLADGGVRLISLQKLEGSPSDDPGTTAPWLELLGDDFDRGPDGFVDTAALMDSLDLIVTCDTSIAHLAGALGRPVIVLLQALADWRWLTDREDCPWYPTMRLIRQSRLGDWSEPARRLSDEIQKLRSTSSVV